ncbi:MAG: transcription antitermination factor NusB, partial [Candidatus Zixiibacteriota bacterium]
MEESPRRQARELVLKSLYACEIEENHPDDVIRQIIETAELPGRQVEFARNYFQLVRREQSWADDIIQSLSENWEIKRITCLDLIILRMAVVELKYIPDTPVKVALNEAIELAKKYSTGESPSFINGILDN